MADRPPKDGAPVSRRAELAAAAAAVVQAHYGDSAAAELVQRMEQAEAAAVMERFRRSQRRTAPPRAPAQSPTAPDEGVQTARRFLEGMRRAKGGQGGARSPRLIAQAAIRGLDV